MDNLGELDKFLKTYNLPRLNQEETENLNRPIISNEYNEILASMKVKKPFRLKVKEWNLAICNNMDEHRRYYAEWNKSDRERQIPYNLTYMWNLENKTNEQTNHNRKRLTDTENKWVVARREGYVGLGEIGEED